MTRTSRGGSTHPSVRSRASGPSRRGGRPSQAESAHTGERILDAATALFFQHGYGGTSIDAVARRVGIAKRTFYHRYDDKAALFGAVLRRVVDRLRPAPDVRLIEGKDIDTVLLGLARLIARAAVSPEAVALHRLIVAESGRFPQLAAAVANQGGIGEAVHLIAKVLERAARAGTIATADPTRLAEQFLYMVLVVPQRRALGLGPPMMEADLDHWARAVVGLFLDGCRSSTTRRPTAATSRGLRARG
jgi:TetR/AcrR family transcriptional repressor of mexJK operon